MLDLRTVFELASSHGWEQVGEANKKSRVVSFVRLPSSGGNSRERINVYYTTHTVGTCLEHPHSGKTQLFRRDVDLAELEKLFHNPRAHTGRGYYKRARMPVTPPDFSRHRNYKGCSGGCAEHEDGFEICMDNEQHVRSFSLGWHSYVVLMNDGSSNVFFDKKDYRSEGYAELTRFLRQHRSSETLPPPVYVRLYDDSEDCFCFVQYADGSFASHAHPEFLAAVNSPCPSTGEERIVSKVAFGPNKGFVVLFRDGSMEIKGISDSLAQCLKSQQHPPVDISMSHAGDWFVRFADRSCSYDVKAPCFHHAKNRCHFGRRNLLGMEFGFAGCCGSGNDNIAWFVTYSSN
eukprot:CAMPEP_0181322652 /NCGR_PEP_ID=MMETSP1101-20121128/19343_1 /TAXON_ID=46948 /ORGANISM="Rhodomonas abbreviata, Strain Caron Lab Isolate" /LENGTH=346 /DNA_ID=CAMNT_0023430581 /DNA_START=104 /DNA_END=1144 /DNA_ORIENTATION=+